MDRHSDCTGMPLQAMANGASLNGPSSASPVHPPLSQHGSTAAAASSTSGQHQGLDAVAEQPLEELFSGIWLAEDGGPVPASGQNGIDGDAHQHPDAAVPEGRSVLDQLASLPDAADVLGGVSDDLADGEISCPLKSNSAHGNRQAVISVCTRVYQQMLCL